MNNNYSERLNNLKKRYNPDGIFLSKAFSDLDISKLSYHSSSDDYVRFAMAAVDDKFTDDIKKAGNNVKTHLQRTLSNVDYEYQGSVMTDTHIKANSDIDLLVISNRFFNIPSNFELQSMINDYSLNTSQRTLAQDIINSPRFTEDSDAVLLQNRKLSEETLQRQYISCDTKKSKCVTIYNSDLRKYVDTVIACYNDDVFSLKNLREKKYRGIKIYEKNVGTGKTDHPFFTIDSINTKSALAHGRLKKMIRFLKNFMFDSSYNYQELKSFGVNIICYNIEVSRYNTLHYVELLLIMQQQLKKIITDSIYMSSLTSIDGSEKLFYDSNGNFYDKKFNEVKQLENELSFLINDIYYNFRKAL